MANEVVGLNVVILPPSDIARHAIDLSNKLFDSEVGASFRLEAGKLYPHITIYQAFLPASNIPEIKNRLSKLANELVGFTINLSSFSIVFDNWLFWNCEKTKALDDLQAKVIEQLNPLREGHLPPTVNVSTLPSEHAKDVNTFGSLLIGKRYLPHITITHIKDPNNTKNAFKVTGESLVRYFKLNEISLATLGELGTVTGIIEQYQIAQ